MSKRNLIGIFGLGVFGRSIAKSLEDFDVDVIVVDKNEQLINECADNVFEAIVGDITDKDFLEHIGVDNCQVVVVSTGSNLESSSLAVLHLAELGIPRIICKAGSKSYADILKAIGATDIIMPEKESGRRLAKALVQENIFDILDLDDQTSIIDFYPPHSWIGKSLDEIDSRNKYGINIIGFRSSIHDPININIKASSIVEKNIILVGLAKNRVIENHDFLRDIK